MAATGLVQLPGRPAGAPSSGRRSPARQPGLLDLQSWAGNRVVTALVQRDKGLDPMDPRRFATYGQWLASLPSGAVDDTALDVTGEVGRHLPQLAGLVIDLKADCADVTILLKHFYNEAHGTTISIPARADDDPRNRIHYDIGAGVTRQQLRAALVNLGTTHFQEMRVKDRIVRYYGGAKPLTNLVQIVKAGLEAGDVLVWEKLAGVKGSFSGHVQTVQHIWQSSPDGGSALEIDVLQGTMKAGKAVSQVQSKKLTAMLLTGRADGDGDIRFRPDDEERFFGAGKW